MHKQTKDGHSDAQASKKMRRLGHTGILRLPVVVRPPDEGSSMPTRQAPTRSDSADALASQNPCRRALLERRITLGSWIQIGHPASAEILANAGYEWVGIDCEHTEIDLTTLANILRGLVGRGVTPLVRVREAETLAIRQVLDLGAAGVIVPLVGSADQARRAVAAAKYPPQGVRGYCFSRMNDYGSRFKEYAASANRNTVVVAMIESREGVENIEEILAVDGVDGVFLGPYDLSGAYGVPGQTDHALVRQARQTVLDACNRHGKSAGLHIVHPTRPAVNDAFEQGFTFLALSADIVFLNEIARSTLEDVAAVLNDRSDDAHVIEPAPDEASVGSAAAEHNR